MATRTLILALFAVILASLTRERTHAQTPYMRTRPGGAEWSQRGGGYGWGPAQGGYPPFGAYGGGYAASGSWYQRPYPYHLDYYRYRWGAPPSVATECPCADATPQVVEPTPALAEPQL